MLALAVSDAAASPLLALRLQTSLRGVTRALRLALLGASLVAVVRCCVILGTSENLTDLADNHLGWIAGVVVVGVATFFEWSQFQNPAAAFLRRYPWLGDVAFTALMVTTPGYPVDAWGWVVAAVVLPLAFIYFGLSGLAFGLAVSWAVLTGWAVMFADEVLWSDVVQSLVGGAAAGALVVGVIVVLRNLQKQVLDDEAGLRARSDGATKVASTAAHDHVGDLAAARMALTLASSTEVDSERRASLVQDAKDILESAQDRSYASLKLLASAVPKPSTSDSHPVVESLAQAGLEVQGPPEAQMAASPVLVVSTFSCVMAAAGVPAGSTATVAQKGDRWQVLIQTPADSKGGQRLLESVWDLARTAVGGYWGEQDGVLVGELPLAASHSDGVSDGTTP